MHRLQDRPRRLSAGSAAVVRAATTDVSADGLPAWEICQFDGWQARDEVPVGHSHTRQGWVVVACLATRSRAGAGVLFFSKETEDLLAGVAGCPTRLGALPKQLVCDRQTGIHGHTGRPSETFVAFCGQLKAAWRFCEPADPQAKARSSGAGLRGDELRARPPVRQRPGLPRPARRMVSQDERTSAAVGGQPSADRRHRVMRSMSSRCQ